MSNVDFNEVDKFAALASRWWDKNSEFKPLHDINPLRLNYIKKRCSLATSKPASAMSIPVTNAPSLARDSAKIPPPQPTSRIFLSLSEPPHCFLKDNAQTFDVVTCLEMLEHVPDPASIINACATLVKANGSLFFSTLNRNTKSYLFAIIGAEYILKLLPQGTHDWDKFIQPSEMDEWARHSNLTLKNIIGMTYNPFTKTYKLESDVSVNYLCFYQK
jgi:2-polyprenyl-6-hydroxyphenyl methylase/3-demethylubiquinone-9 3-methyltransferase